MMLIEIEDERCDGCALCLAACPADMFGLRDGTAFVKGDPVDCPACPNCTDICVPDAIALFDVKGVAPRQFQKIAS